MLDGHEGRLAVFCDGELLPGTFSSVDSFQLFKPHNDFNSYSLYTIPGDSSNLATAYAVHDIIVPPQQLFGSRSSGFQTIKVPVHFFENNQLLGDIHSYEIDTGASNTSCPCFYDGYQVDVLKESNNKSVGI